MWVRTTATTICDLATGGSIYPFAKRGGIMVVLKIAESYNDLAFVSVTTTDDPAVVDVVDAIYAQIGEGKKASDLRGIGNGIPAPQPMTQSGGNTRSTRSGGMV